MGENVSLIRKFEGGSRSEALHTSLGLAERICCLFRVTCQADLQVVHGPASMVPHRCWQPVLCLLMLSILDVVCGNLGGVPRSILSFDARKRSEVKDLWVRRGGYAPPRGDWNSGSYYEEEEEFVDDRGYYGYDYEQKPKVSVHLTQLIHRISWILISRVLCLPCSEESRPSSSGATHGEQHHGCASASPAQT
jgi:hypothetical protein